MAAITIFHNPACSKSRGALALIREAGHQPQVVEYLKTPPNRAEFAALFAAAGLAPRQGMRSKDALFKELGLDHPATTDAALLDALAAHPALLERPFVVTAKGTALCRPPEAVLPLLPA